MTPSREDRAPESGAFGFGVALSNAPPFGGVTLDICKLLYGTISGEKNY